LIATMNTSNTPLTWDLNEWNAQIRNQECIYNETHRLPEI
jgi:hypothetical protein